MAAQSEQSVPRPLVAFGVWVLIALVVTVMMVVDPWRPKETQALTKDKPATSDGSAEVGIER